jgi:hypothetical protein
VELAKDGKTSHIVFRGLHYFSRLLQREDKITEIWKRKLKLKLNWDKELFTWEISESLNMKKQPHEKLAFSKRNIQNSWNWNEAGFPSGQIVSLHLFPYYSVDRIRASVQAGYQQVSSWFRGRSGHLKAVPKYWADWACG